MGLVGKPDSNHHVFQMKTSHHSKLDLFAPRHLHTKSKLSTEEQIKKISYLYTMEYYSAIKRNRTGPFVETWTALETVIHGEVSQREKQISCIDANMWNLKKVVQMILFTKQKWRHRHREKCMDTKGESGGG